MGATSQLAQPTDAEAAKNVNLLETDSPEKRPAAEVVQASDSPQAAVTLVGSQDGDAADVDTGDASPDKASPAPDHGSEQATLQSPKVENAAESPVGNGSPLAVSECGTPGKEVCMDAAESPKGVTAEPPKPAPQPPQQADSPARRKNACC